MSKTRDLMARAIWDVHAGECGNPCRWNGAHCICKDESIVFADAALGIYQGASFLDLTDAEAGAWLKSFAERAVVWGNKEAAGSDQGTEMTLALSTLAFLQAVKVARATNAKTYTLTMEHVTFSNVDAGDWEIKVTRLREPRPSIGDEIVAAPSEVG